MKEQNTKIVENPQVTFSLGSALPGKHIQFDGDLVKGILKYGETVRLDHFDCLAQKQSGEAVTISQIRANSNERIGEYLKLPSEKINKSVVQPGKGTTFLLDDISTPDRISVCSDQRIEIDTFNIGDERFLHVGMRPKSTYSLMLILGEEPLLAKDAFLRSDRLPDSRSLNDDRLIHGDFRGTYSDIDPKQYGRLKVDVGLLAEAVDYNEKLLVPYFESCGVVLDHKMKGQPIDIEVIYNSSNGFNREKFDRQMNLITKSLSKFAVQYESINNLLTANITK